MSNTIFIIDARDHVFLEVMTDASSLDSTQVYEEIQGMFSRLITILNRKKVKYDNLKYALIPQVKRKEIGLVFDTNLIESSFYGYQVFEKLIPFLDLRSTNSILCGDLLGEDKFRDLIRELFFENINTHKNINYVHHGLFYIVYINNLSEEQFLKIHEGLISFMGYVGYFNLTYSSPLKSILSSGLVRAFLKNKKIIINATEDSEDVNMTSYPFEKFGYKVIGVDDTLYGIFLSYKIEREVFYGNERDTIFSLNAISSNVFDIYEFDLEIEEKKLGYLLKEKADNMNRAGLSILSKSEFEAILMDRLNRNYIYNLSYLSEFDLLKFNIIVEILMNDNRPMKLLVALEYKFIEKKLRIITMF